MTIKTSAPMEHGFACPCCGFLTLGEKPPGTFVICPVCFWEDDDVQYDDPSYEGGANGTSLNQAKKNFASFGAVSIRDLGSVRAPNQDELPGDERGVRSDNARALSITTVRRWALEYIGEAKTVVDQLRLAHPFQDLFRAWRRQEVPRTGDLKGGLHFDFHGSGCIFQSPKRTVDVNFGPQGRCDVFDAWRLFKYAKANYGENAVPCLADFIERVVELEKCGEVKKPGWKPGPHLFYLVLPGLQWVKK